MPSLKNKLANLRVTKLEVVSKKTGQEKSLEELFLEQGFAAFADPTESSLQYTSCFSSPCGQVCEPCQPGR